MEERFNKVCAILGKRGSGKTEYLKGNEIFRLRGLLKGFLAAGKKVLIVDTIDHPSYRDVPVIAKEKIKYWKKGAYRIFVPIHEMDDLLTIIAEHFKGGVVVFEDARKYCLKYIPKPILRLIGDSKQFDVDIVFMFHSFSHVPKDLYAYIEHFEVFKTKIHPACRKDELGGDYDEVCRVFDLVQANPDPFYHLPIDLAA